MTKQCAICSGHYHRDKRHCPYCGAVPLRGILLPHGLLVNTHRLSHVNYLTSINIVRSLGSQLRLD